MSRATASTAVILALLTGLVLGQFGSLARQPAAFRSDASSVTTLATVRTFYDNLNRLLETGDRAIESSIAPGFTEHVSDGQADRTLPEMIDWLLAIRATWPELRVTIVSLDQHDKVIAARLGIDPGEPQAIPGLPLPKAEPMQVTEHLRVDRSGIVDRWSADMRLPVATLALNTEFSSKSPTLTLPGIARVSIEPGRSARIPLAGPALVLVESGAVQLSQAGNDIDGIGRSVLEPIRAGEARALDATGVLIARNLSSSLAELWVFARDLSTPSQVLGSAPGESATAWMYGSIPTRASNLLGATQRISITSITLPPGTEITSREIGGVETIAVIDGEIEITVERGRAVLCTDGVTSVPFDDTATVASGTGVAAKGATILGYRATGSRPTRLLVMRIDSEAGPESGARGPDSGVRRPENDR